MIPHVVRALFAPTIEGQFLCQESENENLYNGEKFIVTEDYIDELKAIDVPIKRPEHHLLLVKMKDETLDSTLAIDKYRNGPCFIEHGGDHSYNDFPKRLPSIINFALAPY